jgi:hypothetical protein
MAGLYEARFPIYGDKTMSWRLRETVSALITSFAERLLKVMTHSLNLANMHIENMTLLPGMAKGATTVQND